MSKPQYLSVTQLNQYIQQKFVNDDHLNQTVYLTGEVSNFRLRDKHQYFSLKDHDSVIHAVMFVREFSNVNFELANGMKVLAIGRVSTYVPTGQYQFYIQHLEPDGVGKLYQAFKQLQAKLQAQGLFDVDHKKALPKYPKKIGVITSPSGAVIRDIIKTVSIRYPLAQVILYPAVVQGDASVNSLCKQLKRLEARNDIDTIIIGRGGGSIEDLWPFNSEKLAQLIYDCKIPIISSVGHQTDFTIADYVADVRAATPTAAAEFAVPVLSEIVDRVNQKQHELQNYFKAVLDQKTLQLDHLANSNVFTAPTKLYDGYLQHVNQLQQSLQQNFKLLLQRKRQQLSTVVSQLQQATPKNRVKLSKQQLLHLQQQLPKLMQQVINQKQQLLSTKLASLKELNPKAVMKNGYSYVTKAGQVVRDIDQVQANDEIILNLLGGQLKVKILEVRKQD